MKRISKCDADYLCETVNVFMAQIIHSSNIIWCFSLLCRGVSVRYSVSYEWKYASNIWIKRFTTLSKLSQLDEDILFFVQGINEHDLKCVRVYQYSATLTAE